MKETTISFTLKKIKDDKKKKILKSKSIEISQKIMNLIQKETKNMDLNGIEKNILIKLICIILIGHTDKEQLLSK